MTAKNKKDKQPKKIKTKEEKAVRKAERRKTFRRSANRYLMVIVGSLIYAVGMGLFLDPNNLSAGGVVGIAMLINHYVPSLGTGFFTLILNIPIMIFGAWKFGFRFISGTMLVLLISAPLLDLFATVPLGVNDLLLNGMIGGALMGVGIGILFRAGVSTGGMDVVTKYLHVRFPHMKMGIIHFGLDLVVLGMTLLVFGKIDIVLYAAVGLVVSSYMMNAVLYGGDGARLVYIVSDTPDVLADELMRQQNLGITYLQGYGAYTGKEKRVILCVLRPKQLPKLREFVAFCDPSAFMIITGATSVFGEGFRSYSDGDV